VSHPAFSSGNSSRHCCNINENEPMDEIESGWMKIQVYQLEIKEKGTRKNLISVLICTSSQLTSLLLAAADRDLTDLNIR